MLAQLGGALQKWCQVMSGKLEALTLNLTMNAAQHGNSGAWKCYIRMQNRSYTPHLCTDTGLITFFFQVLRWLFFINIIL